MSTTRLGIYVDGPYGLVETPDGPRVAPDPADLPFLTFACEVGRSFESTLVFGRDAGSRSRGSATLPAGVRLAGLPHYDDLGRVSQVLRAATGTVRAFWHGLSEVDVVWVFGPHPFSFLLVGLAKLRRRRVVLGVRQDTVTYFRSRTRGAAWSPVLVLAWLLDAGYRFLGTMAPVTVVGPEIAHRYSRGRARALSMEVSLIRRADVVEAPRSRDWSSTIELFTVGRVDREKNPFLLLDAVAALKAERPGRYRLTWVGTGPLDSAVRERAIELGLEREIEFLGFLPFGPGLVDRYRSAHIFVHVSLTEGIPAVILEALASGTPVVATDVGGVRAALGDGAAGVMVPPDDLAALTKAVTRVTDDGALRDRMIAHGLSTARERSLDVQAGRVAAFIERGRAAC